MKNISPATTRRAVFSSFVRPPNSIGRSLADKWSRQFYRLGEWENVLEFVRQIVRIVIDRTKQWGLFYRSGRSKLTHFFRSNSSLIGHSKRRKIVSVSLSPVKFSSSDKSSRPIWSQGAKCSLGALRSNVLERVLSNPRRENLCVGKMSRAC